MTINNQQYFLAAVAVLLAVVALPGLVMEGDLSLQGPDATTREAERAQADDPGLVPETSLTVEKIDEEQRAELEYQRLVNVNTASKDELTRIPRLGDAAADRIIEGREDIGPFICLEDLTLLHRVGETTVENWREYLTVGREYEGEPCLVDEEPETPSPVAGEAINVNTADESTLTELTGIGPVTAQAIIEYRQQHGDFSDLDDLQNVSGIGPATVENIRGSAVAE